MYSMALMTRARRHPIRALAAPMALPVVSFSGCANAALPRVMRDLATDRALVAAVARVIAAATPCTA